MRHRRIETTRSAVPTACTCVRNTRRAPHQKYWQLPCPVHTPVATARPIFKKLNFKYPQRVKKERAMRLHRRAERGLTAYGTCTAVELRNFVRSRGLDGSGTRLTQKSQLIRFLERADEAATFHRFAELPPELRIRIYSFDFGCFEAVTPEPPPLLAARFIIKINRFSGGPQADRPTTKLFERLDPDSLGRINKLRVGWVARSAFGGPFIPLWDVDLLQHDDASMLRPVHGALRRAYDVFRHAQHRENAFARMLEVLRGIQARSTKQKMQQRDLHWMVAAFL